MTMRKWAALLAVALLIAAGCTSGDDTKTNASGSGGNGSGGGGTTTTLDPKEAAEHPGVTANEIKLGITYVDLKAIASVTSISHGDYEASYRAVIDDLNKRGGINGRKIVPVFAPVNPIGTQPAEEACLKLTADDHVFADVGFFLGDAVLCPLENHSTAALGGDMNPERLARAKAPWFTLEPSSDVQSDGVKAFDKAGDLDGKIAVYAIVNDKALLDDTIKPLLSDLGVKPVATAVLDVPPEDTQAAIAQTAVIAQRFKSAGATKVLVVGNGGVSWAKGLATTDYRPQSLFITTNTIFAYTNDAAGADFSVLKDALAADVASKDVIYGEPKMQACLKVIEKATGTTIKKSVDTKTGEPDNFVSALSACRYIGLFETIAKAAGKDLNYATFRAAAAKASPMALPGGTFTFGPAPHADGDPPVFIYEWDASKKDFVQQS
ncbi:MAG: ABC transporter substrate-binding protein [Acidimicrobiia bacterium]|nr:ABC transporter substrate-binding protein [Acidimicrobiia bacterium]